METALGSMITGSSVFAPVPPALVAADSSPDISVDESLGMAGLFASEGCSIRLFGVFFSSHTRGGASAALTVEFVAAPDIDVLDISREAGVTNADADGADNCTCWSGAAAPSTVGCATSPKPRALVAI